MTKTKKTMDHEPQFYKDKRGKYRWRVKSGNKIYAASSQGFASRQKAKQNYKLITEIAHKL